MDKKWKQIGEIGVDAGLCWIGDPCYILHADKPPKEIGTSWHDFCDKIKEMGQSQQFNFDLGHAGLGVVTSTGFGDGLYPVYANIVDGRVKEVKVVFLTE